MSDAHVTVPTEGVVDTPGGFIQGADPRQRQMTAAEWQAANGGNGQGYIQTTGGNTTYAAPNSAGGMQYFTADDIAKARQDEKDKLYGRIEEMNAQLQTLAEEREARLAAEQQAAEAAAEAERVKHDADLDTRQLLEQRQTEWDQRFQMLEQERDRERALREQEGRFAALTEYRRNRIEQEQQTIMPELRDLISGASEEEIERSIAAMQQRTEAILASVQGAVTQQRQQVRGVGVTMPPVGPMEQQTTYESLTPDDIRNMDMPTYTKYRDRLLQQARQQR